MTLKKSLLIVDDSELQRIIIKKGIQSLCPDWEIYEAKNSSEVLKIIKDKNIDFFSIDFNMPGLNGLKLMEKLNIKFPDAKKVLLTASLQDAITEKANLLGGKCIHKPITEKTIEFLVDYFKI